MANVLNVEWTDTAKQHLRDIYEFHSEFDEESAFKVITEIVDAADSIQFLKQFQVDHYNRNYRRIVVGYYKVLYRVHDSTVIIMAIFPTRSDARKMGQL